MKWYLMAIKKYATFSGRSRRKEYWMFMLFNFIFAVAAMLLDMALGFSIINGIGYLYPAYALFAFLPGIAVTVRRLHDAGKSGWFVFVALIPLAGAIWFLVVLCKEGLPLRNKYGPDPKGRGAIEGSMIFTD